MKDFATAVRNGFLEGFLLGPYIVVRVFKSIYRFGRAFARHDIEIIPQKRQRTPA